MKTDLQGHVYPPFPLRPDRALAGLFLAGQGEESTTDLVPPTYMIFLRGETRGVDLFTDLEIPRQRALHGGQRYEWFAPIGWDDDLTVTATIDSVVEKQGRSGRIWFANIIYDYVRADGTLAIRETTRLIERE